MHVIIVGAGRIGANLGKSMCDEGHEVYLIEQAPEEAQKYSDKIDAKIIIGSGSDPETLIKAGVERADLVLAVTTSDETNLVVCSLAGSFGAKRRIARVRNTALQKSINTFGLEQFKLDEVINPELIAADAIIKTIQSPGANEVADFAKGKLLLRDLTWSAARLFAAHALPIFPTRIFPGRFS